MGAGIGLSRIIGMPAILERLNERYNDILDKYDFIVGDWGYDQLRLRGFYKDDRRGASKDQLISTFRRLPV